MLCWWNDKNWTSRYLWICLLLTYQVVLVAIRRLLDCTSCNCLTWVREASSIFGTPRPFAVRISCFWNRTPFLLDRSFLLFVRGPSLPSLRSDLLESTSSVLYQGHPKIPNCIHPLYRLPEELNWSGLLDSFSSRNEQPGFTLPSRWWPSYSRVTSAHISSGMSVWCHCCIASHDLLTARWIVKHFYSCKNWYVGISYSKWLQQNSGLVIATTGGIVRVQWPLLLPARQEYCWIDAFII
jgi:hypothetical protein